MGWDNNYNLRRENEPMTRSEFIEKLRDTLEIDTSEEIIEETDLRSLEEYDSLGVLTVIAMIDEDFGKQFSSLDLEKITTVSSLMKLIGEENFE